MGPRGKAENGRTFLCPLRTQMDYLGLVLAGTHGLRIGLMVIGAKLYRRTMAFSVAKGIGSKY
jgi:hypothetical protein